MVYGCCPIVEEGGVQLDKIVAILHIPLMK